VSSPEIHLMLVLHSDTPKSQSIHSLPPSRIRAMPFRSTRPVFASLRSVVRSAPVSGRRFAPYAISLVLGATLIWSDPQILRSEHDREFTFMHSPLSMLD
jgi:hypothetical protein